MSILIVVYILSYVSCTRQTGFRRVFKNSLHTDRWKQRGMNRELPKSRNWCWRRNLLCSAARLRGFEEDLGLTVTQFAAIPSVLYTGYISVQVHSYALYF